MHIETTKTPTGVTVLAVKGDMWHADVWNLHRAVKELAESGEARVVADLAHVERISSEGFGVIAACAEALKAAGGSLRLAGANPTLTKHFALLHISDIVGTHATVDEAVAAFA